MRNSTNQRSLVHGTLIVAALSFLALSIGCTGGKAGDDSTDVADVFNNRNVNLYKEEQTVWEDAPLQGSVQDCPDKTGTLTYGVQVWNAVDDTIWQEQQLQVSE